MQAPPINPAHDVSEDVHLSPPFVLVEGVLNCRALPLSSSITPSFPEAVPASKTWILRSGDISRITALGIAQLHSYRIRKIFDLRTPSDIVKFKSPAPIIEGVDIVNAPLVQDPYASSGEDASNNGDVGWYSQDNMRKQYAKFREDELRAFMKDYTGALEEGREVIAKMLRSLVNRQAGEGIMFHCNAGKDRTGVIAALILSIVGVEDSAIVQDYALTSPGFAPYSAAILARVRISPECASPPSHICLVDSDLTLHKFEKDAAFREEREGAMNMFSSRPETMHAFLALLREKYGGAEDYARNVAGLTEAEILAGN